MAVWHALLVQALVLLARRLAGRDPCGHVLAAQGGILDGRFRRSGSSASTWAVAPATAATAALNASRVTSVTFPMPVTLRMYWIAAASISSGVAGGSSPRKVVMLRHMVGRYAARADTKHAIHQGPDPTRPGNGRGCGSPEPTAIFDGIARWWGADAGGSWWWAPVASPAGA